MPDGWPISWRSDFRNRVIDLASRLGVPLLDPCQLVLRHGIDTALMKGNVIHWSTDFLPAVAEIYKRFVLNEVLQFVHSRADYD